MTMQRSHVKCQSLVKPTNACLNNPLSEGHIHELERGNNMSKHLSYLRTRVLYNGD